MSRPNRCPRAADLRDLLLADPEAQLPAHASECFDCASVVAEMRRFDAALRGAAGSLVTEPLPAARLLLEPSDARPGLTQKDDDESELATPAGVTVRRRSGSGRPGLSTVATLAAAAAVVLAVAASASQGRFDGISRLLGSAGPSPEASAPAASTGPSPSAAVSASPAPTPGTTSAACSNAFTALAGSWSSVADGATSAALLPAGTLAAVTSTFSACDVTGIRAVSRASSTSGASGASPAVAPMLEKLLRSWCTWDELVETQVCLEVAATQSRSYRVVSGETLTSIAVRFHMSVAVLVDANPQIPNPDIIAAGDVITIPAWGDPPTSSPAASGGLSP